MLELSDNITVMFQTSSKVHYYDSFYCDSILLLHCTVTPVPLHTRLLLLLSVLHLVYHYFSYRIDYDERIVL